MPLLSDNAFVGATMTGTVITTKVCNATSTVRGEDKVKTTVKMAEGKASDVAFLLHS